MTGDVSTCGMVVHLLHAVRCMYGICPHDRHQHAHQLTSGRRRHSVLATRSAEQDFWVLPASKCNWENYNPKTWHAVMYSSVHHSFSDAPAIKPMPIQVGPMDPMNQPPDQPDHPMPDPRPPTPPDEHMSGPPPNPPHQPDQHDRPDHPMPPAPPGVSPDSPVDPPLPPRDKPGRGTPAVKRQKPPFFLKWTQSTGR